MNTTRATLGRSVSLPYARHTDTRDCLFSISSSSSVNRPAVRRLKRRVASHRVERESQKLKTGHRLDVGTRFARRIDCRSRDDYYDYKDYGCFFVIDASFPSTSSSAWRAVGAWVGRRMGEATPGQRRRRGREERIEAKSEATIERDASLLVCAMTTVMTVDR